MPGIIPFDELFPLTAMPELAFRVFGWNPNLDKNEGVTLQQVATLLGVTNPDWSNIQNKPASFPPSAHTLGSHSNVDNAVDSSPDGVVFGKVGGVWKSVVLNYLSPGDVPNVPAWVLGITEAEIAQWNQAFSWGNHAGLYRPISWNPNWNQIEGKPATFAPDPHTIGSHSDAQVTGQTVGQLLRWNGTKWENWTANFLTSFTETDPIFTASPAFDITIGNIAQWNAMVSFLAGVDDYYVPHAVGGELKQGKFKAVPTENPNPEDEDFVSEVDHYEFESPVKIMPAVEGYEPVRLDQLPEIPTAEDLGLGSFVGLTPDTLPISDPTKEALDLKADKTDIPNELVVALPLWIWDGNPTLLIPDGSEYGESWKFIDVEKFLWRGDSYGPKALNILYPSLDLKSITVFTSKVEPRVGDEIYLEIKYKRLN